MNGVPSSPIPWNHGAIIDREAPPFPNPHAHVEFYERFKSEVDECDCNITVGYDDYMSIIAISGFLLSLVTSIFVIDVQNQLRLVPPQSASTGPSIVHIRTMLCLSLAISLLAAFAAISGKQWINRYSQARMRGSVVDQGRRRLAMFSATWYIHIAVECSPLMLQAAFLLLVCALSSHLSFVNSAISGAVIGSVAFGLLSYSLATSPTIFSYNSPSQDPLFVALRLLARSGDERRKCFGAGKLLGSTFCWGKTCGRLGTGGPTLSDYKTFDGKEVGDHIELVIASPTSQQYPRFNQAIGWNDHVLDSNSVAWMLEMPTEEDVLQTIMKVIPEIVWHAGIRTTPLERVYDTLLECFDCSSGRPVLIPTLRNKAYLSAKAFLHLAVQHKCFGHESNGTAFESISDRHQILGYGYFGWDADLISTLSAIDRVLGGELDSVHWGVTPFTIGHHTWMGHIFLYRAWDLTSKGERLPEDIRQFVLDSLRHNPPVPPPIVADCMHIAGLVLGIRIHVNDLRVTDKSTELLPQVGRIYDKLFETFQKPYPTTDEVDRAIEAMELVTFLRAEETLKRGYPLFQVIMETPVSATYSQEKKWKASRFAMRGAFKWDWGMPPVKDLRGIPTFLGHHADSALEGDESKDKPIRNALRGLSFATTEALEHLDPTEPSFVRGVCYALQDNKSFDLRRAAVAFLPLISDRWFDTPDPIMDADQMKTLCVGWASVADEAESEDNIGEALFNVFLGMMNSPHWRPHIVAEKWKILTSIPWDSVDSEPLKKCLDNPGLITALSMENPAALTDWLTVLWLKYKELVPDVRERLEAVTGEIAQSGGTAIVVHLAAIDSELTKAGDELANHDAWSGNPRAVSLRTKVENLKQVRATLAAFERD